MSIVKYDVRQALAIKYYKTPTSETFGNLRKSMIKAGYEEKYASTIGGRDLEWLNASIKQDVRMVQQAERNLRRYNDMKIDIRTKLDVDKAKLQADVSKFILKTLAKQKYSDSELAEAPQVTVNIVNYNEKDTKDIKDIEVKNDNPTA